jgi:hypothetical protein
VQETLARLGLARAAQVIESDVEVEVERLWDERLRTRFAS